MKFNRMVRPAVAAAASLAISLGLSACSRDYTAAYVYAVSASTGGINAYGVDYESGVLTQINGSPFPSGLTNPSTVVATPDSKFLYVIGGTQNSEVVEEQIGTDGKLYAQSTYNITGTYPTAATVDPTQSFLYVTYQYQKAYTPASPGPGGVTIFPIKSDGSLGTATDLPLGLDPVGIAVSAPVCSSAAVFSTNTSCMTGVSGSGHENVFVYIVQQTNATVLEFAQNQTTGALTPTPQTTCTTSSPSNCVGLAVGVTPSAVAVDPTGRFAYVTDKTSNLIYGFTIAASGSTSLTANGTLTAMKTSPFTTGLYPVAITIDPRGDYLYTANYNSNTVSGFAISSADGTLGGTASVAAFTTRTNPSCVTIEPALGLYLYTSDYEAGTLSGAKLSPNTGQLTGVPDNPFPTSPLPSCVVAVANGSHAASYPHPTT